MTFLNPLILWGLAAVSIPILIHIFNLKKTKKIEFSTLMFLKEIQQTKYKKIKIKQLLILLARIAFIILLVMMFAAPFYSGYLGSAGEKARSSVLIILDDSFSMTSREQSGSSFENAKKRITETLDLLDENDEVFFTTVSGIGRPERNTGFTEISRLKDTLQNIKASDVTKNLSEIIYFANEILSSASNTQKEIYLFTDGQKSYIETSPENSVKIKTDNQTNFNIVLTSSREPANISIDTVNVVTKIFEKNKPVKITAAVTNHNNYNLTNKSITMHYGSVTDEKVIDIPANSRIDTEFLTEPAGTGFSGGYIEITQSEAADDEISRDNRQYFEFFIPEKINVLIASGSANDLVYIDLAVSATEELMKSVVGRETGKNYFEITRIRSNELSLMNLENYDAAVIINKEQFTQRDAEKIKQYTENGGGVIVFPGSRFSPDNFNSTVMKELNLPYISSFSKTGSYRFGIIDFSHPVFEGIFKKGSEGSKLNVESPEIKSALGLSSGNNSVSPVKLSDGSNFMVEYSSGKGKLLLFSIPPDMSLSDFPSKNLFVPVIIRSILYMNNINGIKPGITGKDYFTDFKYKGTDTLKITENQKKFSVNLPLLNSGSLLNLKNEISNTSLYSVSGINGTVYEFPVNFSNRETETGRFTESELSNYISESYGFEANIIKHGNTVSASITELRTGKELWQYFLILAVIFLIIEFILSKNMINTGKKINKVNKSD